MWRQFSGTNVMVVRIAGAGQGRGAFFRGEAFLTSGVNELSPNFHYWRGASGRRYIHTVYSLLECPQLPIANYVLVAREGNGQRVALRIGQTKETSWSLNLAHLRERAAKIGANEVHVHVLAERHDKRVLVEADLQAGLFSSLSAERQPNLAAAHI